MQIRIEDASYDQLLAYAQTALDLDVKRGTQTGRIIEQIRAVQPDISHIDVEDGAPEPQPRMTVEPAGNSYRGDPKVVVNISTDEGEGGDRAVPLTVNGDMILVKRDTDVAIPYRFFEVLENAVATDMRQHEEAGKFITTRRQVKAMRYTIVEKPPQPVIAEWRARTADINRAAKDRLKAKKLAA